MLRAMGRLEALAWRLFAFVVLGAVAQAQVGRIDARVKRVDIPLSGPVADGGNTAPAQRPPVASSRRRFRSPAAPPSPLRTNAAVPIVDAPPLEGPQAPPLASPRPVADASVSDAPPLALPGVPSEGPDQAAPTLDLVLPRTDAGNTELAPLSTRPNAIGLEVVPDDVPMGAANTADLPDPLVENERPNQPRVSEDIEPDDEPEDRAESLPRPRKRLFGRLLGRDDTHIPPAPRARAANADKDVVDPDEDAALQRRLEAEVRQVAGQHVRDADVVVQGRRVRIRATVDRFWNRRMVRRAIEEMPTLVGYDAIVVVN